MHPKFRLPLLLAALSSAALAVGPALTVKQKVPNRPERDVSGRSLYTKAKPPTAAPKTIPGLVDFVAQYPGSSVTFKNEEKPALKGDDQFMTPTTAKKLNTLGTLVAKQWPGYHLRVTEAYDREGEHADNSLHYAGQALDLTVAQGNNPTGGVPDARKLGLMGRLAVDAGFDWVWFESNAPASAHVHVSNKQ